MAESLAGNMIASLLRVPKQPKELFVIVQAAAPTVDLNAVEGAPRRRFERLCGVNIFAPTAVQAVSDHLAKLAKAAVRVEDDANEFVSAPQNLVDLTMDGGTEREHGEHLADGGSPPEQPRIRALSEATPRSMAWALGLDRDGRAAPPLAASANAVATAPQTRSQTKSKPSMIRVSGPSDSEGDDLSPVSAKKPTPQRVTGGAPKPRAQEALPAKRVHERAEEAQNDSDAGERTPKLYPFQR